MGGIAGLIGIDVKKWNTVADRLIAIEDRLLPLIEELRVVVAEVKELLDIAMDKPTTPT